MENIIRQKEMITAVPFSENLKGEWDQFVEYKSINSTFLHSRMFYDHNPLNAKEDASLIFYKEKKIIAVFPAVLYVKDGNLTLHSHLRATYGGIVVSKDVNVEIAVKLIELIILFAKEKKVKQILVRNSFRIFHTDLCDETDYALWFHGFEIKSRELEIAVPICGNNKIIKSQYHNNTSRNIKKALRSVEVIVSNDFKAYWVLLEKCLLERHGKRPAHDFNSIRKLREHLSNDEILLFAAYYNHKLIGGIVVFNFAGLGLHSQYIASDSEFRHLNPVHAIIDYVIDWGNKRGVKYLNLGMANEDDGKKINLGLFRFKESFGGRGVLRETMYLNII